jgi:hypothetical protein
MFLALIVMVVVEWFSFEVRLEAILGLYIPLPMQTAPK